MFFALFLSFHIIFLPYVPAALCSLLSPSFLSIYLSYFSVSLTDLPLLSASFCFPTSFCCLLARDCHDHLMHLAIDCGITDAKLPYVREIQAKLRVSAVIFLIILAAFQNCLFLYFVSSKFLG